MKLAHIQTYVLRYPDASDLQQPRMTVLVRLETADGVIGWGEAVALWPEACRATVLLIEEGYWPLLQQAGETSVEKCWQAMRRHSEWYGEGGIASFALSAIDMALWDIRGKLENQPLWALWGRFHEGLPASANCQVGTKNLSACIDEILGLVSAGFRSVKLGLRMDSRSAVGRDTDSSIALVAGLRRELGPDVEILVDVGNGLHWDADIAIDTVRRMAGQGIGWIEEPFHPAHLEDHRVLKAAVAVPIAGGGREWTVTHYQRLIDSATLDVLCVDPARAEGITGFREIDRCAGAARLKVSAQAWSTAITTAASLHLSLASPNTRLFELKPSLVQHELVSRPAEQLAGWVTVPHGPGLGVEVDEAVVRRLTYRA